MGGGKGKWGKGGKGKGGKGKNTDKKLENGSLSSCMIGEKGSDDFGGRINFYQSDTEGADTSARAKFWNLQTEETVDEVTTPAGVYTIDIAPVLLLPIPMLVPPTMSAVQALLPPLSPTPSLLRLERETSMAMVTSTMTRQA